MSPLSGAEPDWEPDRWIGNSNNEMFNNCWAYSLTDLEPNADLRPSKPTPGPNKDFYTCQDITDGLNAEVPGNYRTDFDSRCAPGFHKIFFTVSDEKKSNDFHVYRQESDGLWSHKPGSLEPTRLDAAGKMICNPETADRSTRSRNYSIPCGFFCIPQGSRDMPS